MMNLDWQTGVVLACVTLAAVALLRPVLQRWRTPVDQASTSPATGDSAANRSARRSTQPSTTCGSCRGCSSGGCH